VRIVQSLTLPTARSSSPVLAGAFAPAAAAGPITTTTTATTSVPAVAAAAASGGGALSPAVITQRVELAASPSVEYYNQALVAWEPLVEPFEMRLALAVPSLSRPRCNGAVHWRVARDGYPGAQITVPLRPAAVAADSGSTDTEADPRVPPPSLKLELPRPVNVNVTMALLHVLGATAASFSRATAADGRRAAGTAGVAAVGSEDSADDGAIGGTDLPAMALRNDAGLLLRYWTQDAAAACAVGPGGERALTLADLDATATATAGSAGAVARARRRSDGVAGGSRL